MNKFVLCCVSSVPLKEEFHRDLSKLLESHSATAEKHIHLSETGHWALDMPVTFSKARDEEKLKFDLIEISNKHKVDMALLPDHPSRSNKKLIVFDMDSTLIQHEVIDEMALVYGVGDKVKLITERAMNGELQFDDALRERVALLKGFPKKEMESIAARLKLTPGAKKLIEVLKTRGYKTAIVSGGFQYFAEGIQKRLGIDYIYANTLDWDGDVLSGKVLGNIVNAEFKARMIDTLAAQEKVTIDEVVAVGDGANDIPMLLRAGFGIAFHAKEKVKKAARHQMGHGPMTVILYFLGIPGNHFDETI